MLGTLSSDLPSQPRHGEATAVVEGRVMGIVLHLRLPGAGYDERGQVAIVWLLHGIALNVKAELLTCLWLLQSPLLLPHRRHLRVVDMAAVAQLVGRIRAVSTHILGIRITPCL